MNGLPPDRLPTRDELVDTLYQMTTDEWEVFLARQNHSWLSIVEGRIRERHVPSSYLSVIIRLLLAAAFLIGTLVFMSPGHRADQLSVLVIATTTLGALLRFIVKHAPSSRAARWLESPNQWGMS